MGSPANPSLQAALAALGSGAAWLAVAILIINDHYLKFEFPSTLTGKLSDVAQLFVLPIAVTVIALYATAAFPRAAYRVSVACYAAIAIVFVGIKVVSGAGDAMRTALAPVTGGGITGVTDPTDLIALPALLLSFAALRHGLRASGTRAPLYRALPVLGLIVFATVANTPGVPPNVQLLAHPDRSGVFYALYVDETYYGDTYPRGIYRTVDAGRTWTRIGVGAQRFALDPEVPGGLLTLTGENVQTLGANEAGSSATATPSATRELYGARRLFVVTAWPTRDIYIVRAGSLARSSDRGRTWEDLRSAKDLADVAAATEPGILLAVVDRRTLVSTDRGATWLDLGAFPAEYARLGLDPWDAQRVVAATDKGVFLSTDGGRGWRHVWNKKGIPHGRDFKAVVVFDREHPDRVYATLGADVGLLVSGDRGASWNESELPALAVAVGREPAPRIFIHADYRGVFHESRAWPELEPWTKANAGLPFR